MSTKIAVSEKLKQCSGIRLDGARCTRFIYDKSGYCYIHMRNRRSKKQAHKIIRSNLRAALIKEIQAGVSRHGKADIKYLIMSNGSNIPANVDAPIPFDMNVEDVDLLSTLDLNAEP